MAAQAAKYNTKKNPYFKQQFNTASPEKLILMLYDLGIRSCQSNDKAKAAKVLIELISSLNFEYHDAAMTFFQLYRYALDQVHAQKFDNAQMVLEGIRDAWATHVLGMRGLNN